VTRKIALRELIREKLIGRGVVRDSQQSLGERHDRQPLARREGKFVQEVFDAPQRVTPFANAADERQRIVFYRQSSGGVRPRPEKRFSEALVGRRIRRREGRRRIVCPIHSS